MFRPNFQFLTDSYKVSHWKQLRPNTTTIYSHLMSRGGVFPVMPFVGLMPKLERLVEALYYINLEIGLARKMWTGHFRNPDIYNVAGWEEICKLRYLPLVIKAPPEGTVVPTKNVLLTVENTDPRFPWLTNWVETQLMHMWYPITVAAQSREIRVLLAKYLELTVGSTDGLDFMLHDFGFRGCTCVEQAAIGGAAHLATGFQGTDTAVALEYLEYYYGAKNTEEMCIGSSVPAAEHSTITSWGREREKDAYENMLQQFPDGIIAVVSDSYDIFNACKNIWGKELKAHVLDRNGTVVIRPDSGYPPNVVTKCLDLLGEAFGFEFNSKGFKVLNPKVRLIQGDGVDYDMIRNVLHQMYNYKWAANNVAFGMGGALLQKLNRDTQRMALKCSGTIADGVWYDVSKDPITDPGKKSMAGRVALIKRDGELVTVPGPHEDDLLVEYFRDGQILQHPTIYEIRERTRL